MKAAQYPKGVSGNPRGRPKSKPITDQIKKILERKVKDKDYTYLELFACRNVTRALQGNNAMTREVWNRIEGILHVEPKADDLTQVGVKVIIDDAPRPTPSSASTRSASAGLKRQRKQRGRLIIGSSGSSSAVYQD